MHWRTFYAIAALYATGGHANPLERRQATTTSPSSSSSTSSTSTSSSSQTSQSIHTGEYISILPNGSPTTITPSATVINGATTTLNIMPTSGAAKTTSASGSSPTPNTDPVMGCSAQLPGFEPFCGPANSSEVWTGSKFYWTWEPSALPSNSTVKIVLNFVDPYPMAGTQAYEADADSALGYIAITMDPNWLHSLQRNNISTTMVNQVNGDTVAKQYQGPYVSLTSPPADHLPSNTGDGINKKGLAIGLPVVFGFIFIVLFGVCLWNRKARRIGPVKWRQRDLGLPGGQKRTRKAMTAEARQRELMEGEEHNGYSDEPFAVGDGRIDGPWEKRENGNGHRRNESLGSLADGDGMELNEFRREMKRQDRL